jgi:hypothetical protein
MAAILKQSQSDAFKLTILCFSMTPNTWIAIFLPGCDVSYLAHTFFHKAVSYLGLKFHFWAEKFKPRLKTSYRV